MHNRYGVAERVIKLKVKDITVKHFISVWLVLIALSLTYIVIQVLPSLWKTAPTIAASIVGTFIVVSMLGCMYFVFVTLIYHMNHKDRG